MNEAQTEKPIGRIYAEIGGRLLFYEGPIEERPESMRVLDCKLGLIDVSRAAIKQIIWKGPAPAAPAAQGGRS